MTAERPAYAAFALLCCAVAAALLWWRIAWAEAEVPHADAVRYSRYVVALLDSGTFGLATPVTLEAAPGRANAPLYPGFAAAALWLGGVEADTLSCYIERDAECGAQMLAGLLNAQSVIAFLTIAGIALTAWLVFGRRAAWIAAAMAGLSGQVTGFAEQLLTENLTMAGVAWLGVWLVLARDGRRRWWAAAGATLGLLTLTRPEFQYLLIAAVVAAGIACFAQRARAIAVLALLLAYIAVCLPWHLRNQLEFGDPALTAGYGGRILAYRVQYNAMSLPELGAAFVYWLPDFGDSLAAAVFPPAWYERLDFGPGSHFSRGKGYYETVAERIGGEAGVTATLLREEVLAAPVRHAVVTLALAWRGIFIGKLWGFFALIAWALTLWRHAERRQTVLLLSAAPFFMLLFYAAVSVAVPRYAVCFVPLFSIALGAALAGRGAAR